MSHDHLKKKLKDLASRAASDEALKRRLLADATEVVREEALEVPPDQRVMAVLHEDAVEVFLLPAMVVDGELTIGELEQVVGACGLSQSPFGMGNGASVP